MYGIANNPDPVKLSIFKERLKDCDDMIYTKAAVGSGFSATMLSIDGMINTQLIDDYILLPLANDSKLSACKSEREAIDLIMKGRVYHSQRKLCDTLSEAMSDLLFGSAVLVFDNEDVAISFDVKGFDTRSVSEPTTEPSISGGKDAFTESIRTNTALLRKRIQTNDLKAVHFTMGRRTNTPVCVMYVSGIADGSIASDVIDKLKAADIDGLIVSRQLESLLAKNNFTIFPQVMHTERADRCAANLVEGRIVVIADGIPVGFIVPTDINSFMQVEEDYSRHYIVSSMLRVMRYIVALLSLTLPGLYISITSFHQEIIPTKLAIAVIASKLGVPFPSFIEVFIMLIALELLLEAAARLPQAIGQAVGTVGAIVVGQAAIAANILSPAVVIIIATAGICGFVIPNQDLAVALRLERLGLALLSTICGLFGLTIGLVLIIYNMCTIEVFGTPYVSPAGGSEWRQLLSDTILRISWSKKLERPANIHPVDNIRARNTEHNDNVDA